MTVQPDHEFEVLEDDQTVPPRPEEVIADAPREGLAFPGQEPPAAAPAKTAPAATATDGG